jgi:hypothetical protein
MTAQRTFPLGPVLGLALVCAAILGASPPLARAAATPTDTATATPSPTPPPGQATLQMSRTHGQASQQITLLGQGFAPQTPLTIWLDSTSGALLDTPTTDGSGHFSDTIRCRPGPRVARTNCWPTGVVRSWRRSCTRWMPRRRPARASRSPSR